MMQDLYARERFKALIVCLLLAGALLVGFGLGQRPAQPAEASGLLAYQTTQLADGTTAYTTTAYSDPVFSAVFGEAQVQVTSDISGTATTTATVQFSNAAAACASITDWFDAATTVTVSGDGTGGSVYFDVLGKCMRVKLSGGSTYTPTVFTRLVNRR